MLRGRGMRYEGKRLSSVFFIYTLPHVHLSLMRIV